MSNEIEQELEQVESGEAPGVAAAPAGSAWDGTVDAILAGGREEREANEVAKDLRGLTVQALLDPSSVAAEMKRRGDYLRSRPMQERTRAWELEVLGGVDQIEAQARELVLRLATGAVTELAAVREVEILSLATYALRTRYHALLAMQDEPWAARVKAEAPESRRRELREIEGFLARKRQREARRKAG